MSAVSAFDSAVSELMAKTNCSRDRAQQIIREQSGLAREDASTIDSAQAERQLEKAEQWECVRIYRAHGCEVYSTSQARAAKVSPGLPDLIVFHVRAGAHWYHEVKRPVGGVQSSAQAEFQSHCEATGMQYVLGDRSEAWATLRKLGITDPGGA